MAGRSQANINGTDASEFPSAPVTDGDGSQRLSIEPKELRNAISKVAVAAATEESRPVLTGVVLRMEHNQFAMAVADGFRLAVYKGEATDNDAGDRSHHLPDRNCNPKPPEDEKREPPQRGRTHIRHERQPHRQSHKGGRKSGGADRQLLGALPQRRNGARPVGRRGRTPGPDDCRQADQPGDAGQIHEEHVGRTGRRSTVLRRTRRHSQPCGRSAQGILIVAPQPCHSERSDGWHSSQE